MKETKQTANLRNNHFYQVILYLNISLYSPYYADACNEFAVTISVTLCQGNSYRYLRRCWSGGEPFTALYKVWPAFGIRTLDNDFYWKLRNYTELQKAYLPEII